MSNETIGKRTCYPDSFKAGSENDHRKLSTENRSWSQYPEEGWLVMANGFSGLWEVAQYQTRASAELACEGFAHGHPGSCFFVVKVMSRSRVPVQEVATERYN